RTGCVQARRETENDLVSARAENPRRNFDQQRAAPRRETIERVVAGVAAVALVDHRAVQPLQCHVSVEPGDLSSRRIFDADIECMITVEPVDRISARLSLRDHALDVKWPIRRSRLVAYENSAGQPFRALR